MTGLKFKLAAIAFGALVLARPGLTAENWPDSLDHYVAHVRNAIKTTDMAGYLAVVKNPNGALLLDVREEAEYRTGHIPGTVDIPRGLLEFRIWRQLGYPGKVDLKKKIYVQCWGGNRAILAAKQLQDIGFTNVTAVVMELADWQNKGYPFVDGESK